MIFKKIYVEITNHCNLNCPFCIGNTRPQEFISLEKFQLLLQKIKGYTNYLYFHVLGEPLLHPDINTLIDLASQNFQINLTTNGFFIERIMHNPNIRQVNISLQSILNYDVETIKKYLDKVFLASDNLVKNNTIINYRIWIDNQNKDIIIKALKDKYNVEIDSSHSCVLAPNIYLQIEKEFIWPNKNNSYYNINGSCLGCRDHIGILVDGTVVPCCLDNIIKSKLFQELKKGFENNQKIHFLCRSCNFYDSKRKK